MKLFLSWGGATALSLAKAFKKSFLIYYPNVETFISQEDILIGELSLDKIYDSLESADEGLIFLTQSSFARQWVNFESGFIFSKKKQLSVVVFDSEFKLKNLGPLEAFQKFDGKSKDGIITYLSRFNKYKEAGENIVNNHFPNWSKEIEQILNSEHPIDTNISKLYPLFNLDISNAKSNKVYSSLTTKFLTDTSFTLSQIDTKFIIQAENYPIYLLDLQKRLNASTKSIALHNHFEKFWSTPLGGQIRDTASETSERVFVYNTEEDLENDFSNLMLHSKEYKIYILSYEVLTSRYPEFAKDFSIISCDSHKVHAEYNLYSHLRTINFTINNHNTQRYEEAFDDIVRNAIPFEKDYDIQNYDEVRRLVFNYPKDNSNMKLSKNLQKSVEMSSYIEIHDYEKHEEEHAYYLEMLECMISKIDTSRKIRILELGAGTGLLTKRLVKLPNANIVAIELDWACFKRLRHNLKNNEVELIHEDSRRYNPSGKFDIIISSFSDHHIKPEDKFSYFNNVIRNLESDGLFIVGDEFLKDYNPDSHNEYIESLNLYHNHIIQIAENKGQTILASLEREALISGINGLGDFKLSTSIYEKYLDEVNFAYSKELIGPKDVYDIGGVYVYTMRKKMNLKTKDKNGR